MAVPETEPLARADLVEQFNGFVDEMSGGIPTLVVTENAHWYAVVGSTGPVFVDRVEFSTLVDNSASEETDEAVFIRTITLLAGEHQMQEVLHRQEGLAFWDPVGHGGQYIEEFDGDDEEDGSNTELVRAVALNSMQSLLALRDAGRLQLLDTAD